MRTTRARAKELRHTRSHCVGSRVAGDVKSNTRMHPSGCRYERRSCENQVRHTTDLVNPDTHSRMFAVDTGVQLRNSREQEHPSNLVTRGMPTKSQSELTRAIVSRLNKLYTPIVHEIATKAMSICGRMSASQPGWCGYHHGQIVELVDLIASFVSSQLDEETLLPH